MSARTCPRPAIALVELPDARGFEWVDESENPAGRFSLSELRDGGGPSGRRRSPAVCSRGRERDRVDRQTAAILEIEVGRPGCGIDGHEGGVVAVELELRDLRDE